MRAWWVVLAGLVVGCGDVGPVGDASVDASVLASVELSVVETVVPDSLMPVVALPDSSVVSVLPTSSLPLPALLLQPSGSEAAIVIKRNFVETRRMSDSLCEMPASRHARAREHAGKPGRGLGPFGWRAGAAQASGLANSGGLPRSIAFTPIALELIVRLSAAARSSSAEPSA